MLYTYIYLYIYIWYYMFPATGCVGGNILPPWRAAWQVAGWIDSLVLCLDLAHELLQLHLKEGINTGGTTGE